MTTTRRQVTTAVILAAGTGSRRLPITRVIEKAMIPVGNRPSVDYVVEQCVGAGIERIIFVVSSLDSQIKKYYGETVNSFDEYPWLKIKTNIEAIYCVQPSGSYGTGAALLAVKGLIQRDESFIVLVADGFLHDTSTNYVKELISEHTNSSSDGVLVGLVLPAHRAAKYAVISHENGRMSQMVEKPSNLESGQNYHVYITYALMPYEIFNTIELTELENGEIYLTTAINKLAKSRHIHVVFAQTQYFDTGELAPWLEANNYLIGSNT